MVTTEAVLGGSSQAMVLFPDGSERPASQIRRDPRSEMQVTQFDYEDAEKSGLVKFDFLGLKTLTVIAKAEELLKVIPEVEAFLALITDYRGLFPFREQLLHSSDRPRRRPAFWPERP